MSLRERNQIINFQIESFRGLNSGEINIVFSDSHFHERRTTGKIFDEMESLKILKELFL